jgi:CMP-N-acetylneuraminic acid synthetase
VPGKNLRELAGEPLIVRKLRQAKEAGIFTRVLVSTDSPVIGEVVTAAGGEGIIRPKEFATSTAPDIWWLKHALRNYSEDAAGCFAILRCTSPFFGPEDMRLAWAAFTGNQPCDSLRVVRPASEHPGKQWYILDSGFLSPVLPHQHPSGAPWHSSQTTTLPRTWVQAGALEIGWCRIVRQGSITGDVILPYRITADSPQALDINTFADWEAAERYLEKLANEDIHVHR